jgi:mycothiol synthase
VSELPAGLRSAPLGPGDREEIAAVWRACEEHDDGRAEFAEADVVAIFARPSLEPARDSVGVRDGGALVAFGLQLAPRFTFVHVLPAFRGRGIGTWLLRWSQDAARAIGARTTAQDISDGERGAIALLERDGYVRRWDSWAFEIALEAAPPAPLLPAGYSIRDFAPGDERPVHGVIQRAFGEWPDHEPQPYGDWAAMVFERPDFEPALLGVAVHDDSVIGAVLLIDDGIEGWVDQLAVAREHRGRGLGVALLMHAFGRTWARGRRTCGLGTDSRTGARGLYEKVGMRVRQTFGEYAKEL